MTYNNNLSSTFKSAVAPAPVLTPTTGSVPPKNCSTFSSLDVCVTYSVQTRPTILDSPVAPPTSTIMKSNTTSSGRNLVGSQPTVIKTDPEKVFKKTPRETIEPINFPITVIYFSPVTSILQLESLTKSLQEADSTYQENTATPNKHLMDYIE